MIYWFTGQPGHGKTLHAIDKLLEFKEQGRIVYACNVRQFDYEKTGVLEMTPEQFRDWMNFLPDGAVALVDECYEHGMLPKRPPGARVPEHVEQLAKHRHRGLDFIFVSQSPDKQCDQFVHDLIERHVHVRRKFGTHWVQLREFDRFEANAERALPIVNRNVHLLKGKRSVGTYKSTELDTTERRIPWYYYLFGLGIPGALVLFWYVFGNLGERLGGGALPAPAVAHAAYGNSASEPHGAGATGGVARAATVEEYVASFVPRVASQPWSAPVYDSKLSVSNEPPRLFCMLSGPGEGEGGTYRQNSSCTCLTEQGTRYWLDLEACATVARHGQYEPFYDERGEQRHVGGYRQQDMLREDMRLRSAVGVVGGSVGTAPQPMVDPTFGTITREFAMTAVVPRPAVLSPAAMLGLKLYALVAMVLDHVDWFLRDGALGFHDTWGRTVFPVFAVLLAANLARMGDPRRMVGDLPRRMLIVGGIACWPYTSLQGGLLPFNVMWTLAAAVTVCGLLQLRMYLIAGLLGLVAGAFVDYSWFGLLAVVLPWAAFRAGSHALPAFSLACLLLTFVNGSLWALAAVPLLGIAAYVQGHAPRWKWLFYASYPAHLALLVFVKPFV